MYHERVFKLGGVSPHLATPPCLLELATSPSLRLGLLLVVVKIQHGGPALMPPCLLLQLLGLHPRVLWHRQDSPP